MLKIIAIISTYNEEDIISEVLEHLASEKIESYLIDNCSTDGTVKKASEWLNKGLLGIETFPDKSSTQKTQEGLYLWSEILKRKEQLTRELNAEWYIHHDADEFRESPTPILNLNQAISFVDKLGYNSIDFNLINFRPVDDSYRAGESVQERLKYYEMGDSFDSMQIKAWKNTQKPIDLASKAGHSVLFEGRKVFPVKFLLRHYPVRSQEHGLRKVIQERKNRFCESERSRNWHVQYDDIKDESHNFLYDKSSLHLYLPVVTKLRLMARQVVKKSLKAFRMVNV